MARDAYDNHPAVTGNVGKVETKFAKEEWKGYHIHYHWWMYYFLFGLMVSQSSGHLTKAAKGQICIDCSNGPPDKCHSVNSFIPKPLNAKKPQADMILDEDACPPIYFEYAFKRVIRRILVCMHITRPTSPILVHADDIDAAFCRILYHPDMAIAFAYFFEDHLIVPVSQVFGGRLCPPYYGRLADVWEVLAIVRPMDAPAAFHQPLGPGIPTDLDQPHTSDHNPS